MALSPTLAHVSCSGMEAAGEASPASAKGAAAVLPGHLPRADLASCSNSHACVTGVSGV